MSLFGSIFAEQAMYNFPQNVFLTQCLVCECPASSVNVSASSDLWFNTRCLLFFTERPSYKRGTVSKKNYLKYCQGGKAMTSDFCINYLSPLKSIDVKNCETNNL